MTKHLLSAYKFPIAISLTLAVALIALRVARYPLDIALLLTGSLLGFFVLELEYFIYAYIIEPNTDFSKTLTGFVKHWDIPNALSYIQYHKNEIKEKSLNSAIFQGAMAMASIFVVYTETSLFIKALVLSAYVNTIYKLAECYFEKTTDEWFWAFKNKPKEQSVVLYMVVLVGILVFCLSAF